jgi:hypothetical protein
VSWQLFFSNGKGKQLAKINHHFIWGSFGGGGEPKNGIVSQMFFVNLWGATFGNVKCPKS